MSSGLGATSCMEVSELTQKKILDQNYFFWPGIEKVMLTAACFGNQSLYFVNSDKKKNEILESK